MTQTKKHFTRLEKNVIPEHYKIVIKIDPESCKFDGTVEVNIKVNEPCESIVLYSLDLVVTGVELQSGDRKIKASEVKELKNDERIEFVMEGTVPQGPSVLRYDFAGKLEDKLRGLYLCRSKNEKGEQVNSACSHFEAADCRRAFPCWDEPAMKAVFEVTMITKKGLLALSNTMPVEEKDDEEEGWTRTTFEPTPKMSTYLVCFVVGQYDYVEALSARSVRVRVYTPIAKKDQGKFALDMAVKSLDFYEDYFKIPYPLSKIDLIAIPDFAMGAMEHWGLITARETCILNDSAHSTTQGKIQNAMTIAHELAHQWFGNLVTMEWWTYLWLSEGFARFMETVAISLLAPEFDTASQFPCNVLNYALELDALNSSHPIEVEVNHPSEVEEIFDTISYEKGASVIAMLHNFIGEEKFRSGLKLYMDRHSYSNTITEDLWAALNEASGQPVSDVMDTWIKQMGFPIISVKSRESGSNRILVVKQQKFHSMASKSSSKGPQPQWKVPLVIGAAGLKTKTVLLDAAEQEIEFEDAAKAAWIYVNYGASGVFRVHYDSPMLEALLPVIQDKSLPRVDRFMLHSDLFALVKAGYASTKELLKLTAAYSNETELSVWESVFDLMGTLDQLLDDQPALHEKLCCFGRQLFTGIFEKLGWDAKPDDKPSDAILRNRLLGMMVTFGDEKVLKEARRRFGNYVAGTGTIAADARKAVYRAAIMDVDKHPSTWDDLLKLYNAADMQEEAVRIASSLGYARNKDTLLKVVITQMVLEFADSEAVRSQNVLWVIAPVTRSSLGRELAWAHFTKNFNKYMKQFNSGTLFHRLISVVGGSFHTLDKAKEFQTFFQKNAVEGGERTVCQTLEEIEIKANWLQRDEHQMAEFLSKLT
ncbi:puromycin-sensitive aminopeptidase-like [Tropilaelaps mercedesae]|uniref:Aminopeptidase n=1 Tax=Tropilaelaps mercedesae TaxID=418985 RepID=A0A1V9X2A1_9ACAR|nr:puromycin-sensitive aminopeptidase-like [Tropilaelaps mercedesae]